MAKPLVGILMGSDSDLPIMEEAAKILDDFGVPYELTISSAHRTPERTVSFLKSAERRGVKVIIAGAGMAAHLAGFSAATTPLPVIGVPIEAGALKGMDALLSTVQMPGGVPVASMAIGKAGAKNAGIFACQILATSNKRIAAKVKSFRKSQARAVEAKAKKVQKERG
ncbi:MAG: 5-(carboxyamino)imidazole ribonucleotide mutase [Deltaproteobacteria bacterium]|nr:5-(carboxyamino)imidazole ribonucleotide mutase [Deltaproteobacteria bacterium]